MKAILFHQTIFLLLLRKKKKTMIKSRPLVSFDWALKRLLRNKTDFDVVEGFLSELLHRQIKITSVLESESNKKHADDKYNKVDIIVEDDLKEIILIEIQFMPEIDYFQRMLYGVSKAIVEQMMGGDQYKKLKKVYSINILYFDLGQGNDYVYHGKTYFKGLYEEDVLKLSQKQYKVFSKIEAGDVYPEYYVLKVNNYNDYAKNTLDEWIYFFKNDRIQDNFSAQGLLKARQILDYSRLSREEQAEYDYIIDVKRRQLSQIETARYEVEDKYEEKIAQLTQEKDKAFAQMAQEKDKALEEKDKALAQMAQEKDKALEEKDKALAQMAQELAELKRRSNIN
jgi:predicted transposase/invertase (TIGR01784 family)